MIAVYLQLLFTTNVFAIECLEGTMSDNGVVENFTVRECSGDEQYCSQRKYLRPPPGTYIFEFDCMEPREDLMHAEEDKKWAYLARGCDIYYMNYNSFSHVGERRQPTEVWCFCTRPFCNSPTPQEIETLRRKYVPPKENLMLDHGMLNLYDNTGPPPDADGRHFIEYGLQYKDATDAGQYEYYEYEETTTAATEMDTPVGHQRPGLDSMPLAESLSEDFSKLDPNCYHVNCAVDVLKEEGEEPPGYLNLPAGNPIRKTVQDCMNSCKKLKEKCKYWWWVSPGTPPGANYPHSKPFSCYLLNKEADTYGAASILCTDLQDGIIAGQMSTC